MTPRPFTLALVISEYRGDWSPTVKYQAGMTVRFEQAIWLALSKSLNVTPAENGFWKFLVGTPPV